MSKAYYALIVPKADTKRFKIELERLRLLQKGVGIRRCQIDGKHDHMVIPLTLEADCSQTALSTETIGKASDVLKFSNAFGGSPELKKYDVAIVLIEGNASADLNTLQLSLIRSLEACRASILPFVDANSEHLLATIPSSYAIYPPMLLLPVNFFDNEKWAILLAKLEEDAAAKEDFFGALADGMGVTHVAMNAPVLADIEDDSTTNVMENVIRSPSQIRPLHGDFGPRLPPFPRHAPSGRDFEEAFWVSTRQNGITQIWAPLYTMFSGGNVTEKARILQLPSVKDSVRQDQGDGRGCTAVDLFSGVGYFAFSYAKAGVNKVLCWDLSPWSIEGLRRGATANRWKHRTMVDSGDGTKTLSRHDLVDAAAATETFLLSCEDNRFAISRIFGMGNSLPPIRHVNCGMLPTAGASWKIALEVMDPVLGGWIHLHESMNDKDASKHANAYLAMLRRHRDGMIDSNGHVDNIKLEETFRVKSMGPRLWHHVMDFWVPPRSASPTEPP